jgi:hypothetical protein
MLGPFQDLVCLEAYVCWFSILLESVVGGYDDCYG